MPQSTRAAILRSLRTLTRAQRELQALLALAPPGRRLSVPFDVRLEVRAFDVGLAGSLRRLRQELRHARQRTPEEARRLERVWMYWRREAQRALNYPEGARTLALRRLESPDAA